MQNFPMELHGSPLRHWRVSLCALAVAGAMLLSAEPASGHRGSTLSNVPAQPRADARHLIYLHARIIESTEPTRSRSASDFSAHVAIG